jgi:hypothetical protein
MLLQPGLERRFFDGGNAQAKVFEVAACCSGRRTAGASQFAVYIHEVDQGLSRPQLGQADFRRQRALDRATQHIAVKSAHGLEPGGAQHHMVDVPDADHVSSGPIHFFTSGAR